MDGGDAQTLKLSNNPPVRRENKKTERERRRLESIKLMEREAEQKKEGKMRESEIFR